MTFYSVDGFGENYYYIDPAVWSQKSEFPEFNFMVVARNC